RRASSASGSPITSGSCPCSPPRWAASPSPCWARPSRRGTPPGRATSRRSGVSDARPDDRAVAGARLVAQLLAGPMARSPEAVAGEGPQTRAQLRNRLDAARIPTAGQALVHVLVAASLRGIVVRGPMIGNEQAFVSVPAWLGTAPEPLDRGEALARLARRYLAGHGPADERDLARWAGVTIGGARRGFDAIADKLTRLGNGLAHLAEPELPRSPPPSRLP